MKRSAITMQHYTTIISFLLFSLIGHTQKSKAYFQSFKVNDENFDLRTNVVFEDSFGYMWLGTNSGLYRYDGHNLKEYQYDVFNENSIPNNTINSILEDESHNLWIGTESYLVFYDRNKDIFKGFYKNNTVEMMGKTSDGHIWANIWKTGLVKINPAIDSLSLKKIDTATDNDSLLKDKSVRCYFKDAFGRAWLGTTKGLVALDKKNTVYKTQFSETVQQATRYNQNSFLMATLRGIYEIGYRKENRDLEILDYYEYPQGESLSDYDVTDIIVDTKRNEIWIATNKGLIKGIKENNKYNLELIKANNEKGTLNSNQITNLTLDNFGNLWIGTANGINKHLGQSSVLEYLSTPIETEELKTILVDKNNNIWAGVTNGNIYRYSENINGYVRIKKLHEGINKIKYNHNSDELLVATLHSIYTSNDFSAQKNIGLQFLQSFNNEITDLVAINKNEIWVGLWGGGIDIINKKATKSNFKKKIIKQFAGFNVSALHLSKNQKLWVGTRGQGLYKIDLIHEKIEQYQPTKLNGISSNAILCFLETEKGFYIGTRGGGLNSYHSKTNTFTSYSKEAGLKSSTIAAMQSYNNGSIWLSTRKGLARFDEENKSVVNFTKEDGLKENQFVFNESGKDRKGNLFFATPNGIYEVHAKQYRRNNKLASTIVTSVKVMGSESIHNKPILTDYAKKIKDTTTVIQLTHNENNLWFEFTSLDLTNPHKNEYAYILEGVNDYWINTTAANRNANYNGLQPGEYTFKVKSTNSDGVWNEDASVINIKISPPFWKSNTAIFLYILSTFLLLAIAISMVRRWFRLKKNLVTETISRQKDNEHHKMKMVFFTDISHELRTPLTLIQGTIEKVINKDNYKISSDSAKRIHNNSRRMGRLINQIMDIRKFDVGQYKIKISKGNIVIDVLNLKNAFNDFAKIYKIKFDFHCKKENIEGYYDFRILEKVVFNLLSNAFKYTAEGGKVGVHLTEVQLNFNTANNLGLKTGNYIKCDVKDNGVGIPKENLIYIFDRYYQSTKIPTNQIPGTGIGMELVHKLIKSHHGTIIVESEENKYTAFTFFLPIQKNQYTQEEFLMEHEVKKPSILTRSDYQVFDEVTSDGVHKEDKQNNTKATVLLVEDNTELRIMLKKELVDVFKVLEADNGRSGY
ncbi:MAG: two-component regulator propeller domain-containing protein, partial [Flavobacteriaceae bacterium]